LHLSEVYFILHTRNNSRRTYRYLEAGRRLICRFSLRKCQNLWALSSPVEWGVDWSEP
jgi:hypothetical protein